MRKRRLRTVSGILGLLALTFTFVEAGAAAVCGPTSEMQMDPVTAEHAIAGSDTCPECPPAHGGDDTGREGGCPWSLLMGSGCTAPLLLESTASAIPAAVRTQTSFTPAGVLPLSSHHADRLFHPPRA